MKLDLILENVRNKYNLGLLEESEGLDEKALLQGKILINESTMAIRSMLVEEGVLDNVKIYLEEAWTDAVMQTVDDTYEGASDAIDHVAGGAQGLAHGVAATGGVAYGDIKDGKFDGDYSGVPRAIGDVAKFGYEAGYNPDAASVVDTAKNASWVGENPGKAAALAAGTLGAGLAATGAGTYYGAPRILKAGKDAKTGYKMGAANPGLAKVASGGNLSTRLGANMGALRRRFK